MDKHDYFTSDVMDIASLNDPSMKPALCKGCDARVYITTDLPWTAIDHRAWNWQNNSNAGITYISVGTCFDGLAAAAAVEALAHLNGFYFIHSVSTD